MSNTQRILTCALVAASVLAAASTRAQEYCESVLPPSPEISATGDLLYEALVTQDNINTYWSAYSMEKVDWDWGWGYDDCGNVNLPLARAFNAMWAVELSAPPGAGPDNFLTYSHQYVAGSINEIQTDCTLTPPGYALTQYGFFYDDWTRLYLPFFYEESVPVRASTLVHEARHANEVSHNAGSNCPLGGACDSSFDYEGSWRYEVLWLWWFAYTAYAPSWDMRMLALAEANTILGTAFQTDPGFRI